MADSNSSWVVSAQNLAKRLEDPEIVIVDCRFRLNSPNWGEAQYRVNHISGAYYFHLNRDLSSPVQRHGGRHPLPDPTRFAQKLSQCGIIKNHTWVIAYDDARLAFAARLWWLLRYFGHEKTAVLDGGWEAWKHDNYSISADIPANRLGNFQPTPQADWIVHREDLQVFKSERVLIDSRDRDRYLGLHEPIDPIAGHIPEAVNSPWQAVTDEQGFLLPLKQQQSLWNAYMPSSEMVVYCGSGVTACVNLLSLALVGRVDAKLYPGGWSDWCSYLDV